MEGTPTVKRLVMFKHGVAYIERSGPASGPFELSFKKDEMNDVLKSLAVWVAKGDAKVGAIAFEKPEDPQAELERRKLNLPTWGSMLALLSMLKGRKVKVVIGGASREGEIIGIEAEPVGDKGERRRLVLREDETRVSLIDVATIEAFDLAEAPSRADLAFFVDRSRAASAGENRTIRVDIAGAAEDLRVSYVVPAPTWRVSYRIARSDDTTMVMGWGIVHNPVDEDLEGLDLTLTTGQPVSFVIDLYNPKSVHRTVVEEEDRAASAPQRYERAPMAPAQARMASRGAPPPPPAAAPMRMAGSMFGGVAAAEEAPDTGRSLGTLSESMESAASYEDRGELFEYRVNAKIALKRGGSAMVPLFASNVEAKKERIWRVGNKPAPDLVLTFKNTTGAVLEEGPGVIYDENVYAGEAMLPYSARGSEVKLAFAKDLGVRCRHASAQENIATRVALSRNDLVEEVRQETHHDLTAESDYDEPVEVIFELPKMHGRLIAPGSAEPFEETVGFRRVKVMVPPRGRATVKVIEYAVQSQRFQYGSVQLPMLHAWTKKGLLDPSLASRLGEVVKLWADAAAHEQEKRRHDATRSDAYQKQTRISEQLQVLKDGGPEGILRLRYVRELEAEQDKVNAAEGRMRELDIAAATARNTASEKLAMLIAK